MRMECPVLGLAFHGISSPRFVQAMEVQKNRSFSNALHDAIARLVGASDPFAPAYIKWPMKPPIRGKFAFG